MPQHRRLKIVDGNPGEVVSYLDNETTMDPDAGNSSAQGYAIGSIWINTSNDRAWVCVDATPSAAVWIEGLPRSEWAQNGFATRGTSTITFTDGTRTLSIQPTATDFEYWFEGEKFTTTGDTVVITDVDGVHYVYYDGDTLTSTANPTAGQADTIIRTKTLVSVVYWNTTDLNEGIYVGDERHGMSMSPDTHAYLHYINGLAYLSGLALNTIAADENGNLDAHAQFGVDAGAVSDEDLYVSISAVTSTTGLPIYYMLGSGPRWYRYTNAGFSVRTSDGTSATRLAYNQFTGGAWQLTEVPSGDFVLCHVFATTEKDNPMIAIMGQETYSTIVAARAGADAEINELVLNDILFPESRPIGTLIFQTNLSYTNAVNARIRTTSDGDDYVDWRDEAISRTTVSTTDHNSLTGKQGGTADEYYHLTQAKHDAVVSGPASAVDDRIATFDGTTGKLIQDGGEAVTDQLKRDGTRAMTGNLNMGSKDITSLNAIVLGSDAQGDVFYRGASALERLAAGTSGQRLKTNGAAANPAWVDEEKTLLFFISGTLETGAGKIRIRARAAGKIYRVDLQCETAPTGSAIIVDVNKGGTTIFTTQANRPQIAISANHGNTTTINVDAVAANDEFTIDIDQKGSTVAGANLVVEVHYKVDQT